MSDGGYLAPPAKDPSREKIWTETRKRLDRFLPNLFTEIFSESSHQPPQPMSNEVPIAASTSKEEEPHASADSSDAHQNGNVLHEKHQDESSHSRVDTNATTTETAALDNANADDASPDDVD